jgi:N-acylneuraminate cytidylyltransferase
VIPARGGSKRVPGKNIRPLLGRPLIAYTIEAALQSGLFDVVMVSTDSEEIAEIARECGAEVPFLRSVDLADDHTPVSAVTADALRRSGREYANVAQLMANCPTRTATDVRASYDQFVANESSSQLSVTRFGWQNPWWALRRTGSFELEPLFEASITSRSQDLPDLFCPTGAIWWAKPAVLHEHGTFHIAGRTGWEIAWQHGVDIDTEDDWAMAHAVLQSSLDRASVVGG